MSGKFRLMTSVLAAGFFMSSAAALADDPRDPGMRSAAARARDSAETRRLNQGQLAYVRDRDSRIIGDYRRTQSENDAAYARANADYGRRMSAWRRAVAACNAGDRASCDN